jgi:hypothetical protein
MWRAILAGLWLSQVLSDAHPSHAFAQSDDLGDLDDTAAEKKASDSDSIDAESSTGKPTGTSSNEPRAESSGASIVIQPFAGLGFTMRSFRRPLNGGTQELESSVVPAAEAGLLVTAWPEASVSLEFRLIYQSALGFSVTEHPPFALENQVRARSERFALDLGPAWSLGAARLGLSVGGSVRTLWPEVHTLLTPGYSLVGAHGRLQLVTPIAGPVVLRIGPEMQWIMHVDDLLLESGVHSQGLALGGDVVVTVALSKILSLGLSYRESHALIPTNRGVTFTDVERYVTLRVTGTF